jgi:hypothetical protein
MLPPLDTLLIRVQRGSRADRRPPAESAGEPLSKQREQPDDQSYGKEGHNPAWFWSPQSKPSA